MRSCRVMGVYSLLLFTNTLCFLQRGSPLISRSHVITRNQHGGVVRSRRLTTPIRESFLRNVVMMGKPSSPIPRNIKDTVSALRAAVQEGLQARKSRMDVDLPFAAQLGVEAREDADSKKKRTLVLLYEPVVSSTRNQTATMEDVKRSDRELARLFVEMFDVIGDNVVVAFPTDEDAEQATRVWREGAPYKGKVTSMNPRAKQWPKMKRGSPETDAFLGFAAAEAKKKKRQKKKGQGVGGKAGSRGGVAGGEGGGSGASDAGGASGVNRIVPPGTEVLLVVAPQQQELSVVERLSGELGQGCLIVLLNARLHQVTFVNNAQREFFEKEFESMFHLRPVGTETDDFVYRTFPKDWTIARKPKIGPPKVLKSQEARPSDAEITAFVEGSGKPSGVFGNLF